MQTREIHKLFALHADSAEQKMGILVPMNDYLVNSQNTLLLRRNDNALDLKAKSALNDFTLKFEVFINLLKNHAGPERFLKLVKAQNLDDKIRQISKASVPEKKKIGKSIFSTNSIYSSVSSAELESEPKEKQDAVVSFSVLIVDLFKINSDDFLKWELDFKAWLNEYKTFTMMGGVVEMLLESYEVQIQELKLEIAKFECDNNMHEKRKDHDEELYRDSFNLVIKSFKDLLDQSFKYILDVRKSLILDEVFLCGLKS